MLLDSLSNYVTHAAYRLLHHHIPLPSERLLRNLKSESIDSISALCKLREEGLCGNDVVLFLDEMHLNSKCNLMAEISLVVTKVLRCLRAFYASWLYLLKNQFPILLKRYQLSSYQNRSYVKEYSIVSRF